MIRFKNKYTMLLMALLLVTLLVSSGCGSNSADNGQITYGSISPADAKERLDSEEGVILLDVRTQGEYAVKHIPGSILIPVDVLEKEAENNLLDKNAPIFVYCRSGNRSKTASQILINLGYTNVYDLGGIKSWPFETVTGD